MKISRRTFLTMSSLAVGAVIVGGGLTVAKMFGQDEFEAAKEGLTETLGERYGKEQGQILTEQIQQELEVTLAAVPFIGTQEENRWSGNMPSAALGLAAYRILSPDYATLEEVGHMIYETVARGLSGIPSRIMKMAYNEEREIEELTQLALRSQQRQYAEDWVMTYVAGDGEAFVCGVDVTECAILKYLTAQGAPELTRYMCLSDYLFSEAMGKGLVRYNTLAEGCDVCDFRFKQGRASYIHPLREEWPPQFTEC